MVQLIGVDHISHTSFDNFLVGRRGKNIQLKYDKIMVL
jgi:hypothetical protein